ncbi:hypothetical protein [Streptomyces paradoxus]|uniref:Uncharacterized protein n=1 Tax=Streptomyces paradoxus TaxID=66375 RepID=A0A7W9WJD9_9ACTN|nr:hypothetical protein [Streptomyces paradoxus]MBB6079596.1 hypothetical protein [Streptomyces paradoxus]
MRPRQLAVACSLLGVADVGWTPTLHGRIDSGREADRAVARGAGAGRMP